MAPLGRDARLIADRLRGGGAPGPGVFDTGRPLRRGRGGTLRRPRAHERDARRLGGHPSAARPPAGPAVLVRPARPRARCRERGDPGPPVARAARRPAQRDRPRAARPRVRPRGGRPPRAVPAGSGSSRCATGSGDPARQGDARGARRGPDAGGPRSRLRAYARRARGAAADRLPAPRRPPAAPPRPRHHARRCSGARCRTGDYDQVDRADREGGRRPSTEPRG